MANLLHVDKAYNLRVNNFPCKKEKKCPGLDKHLKLFKQSFQVAFELLREVLRTSMVGREGATPRDWDYSVR